jgi:hypothetical protein
MNRPLQYPLNQNQQKEKSVTAGQARDECSVNLACLR